MGIYRGIGGTGDSTSDATLEAVTQKAVEADAAADAAAISETNAASSASSAQTYAGNASTNATAASSSAVSAATSAATSTSSATTATTKASEAATSATNAASSATSAATSASTATTAKDAALAALDSFDDKYLGAKASDPSVDNDGNALSQGTLYYNTTSDVMKVYNGSVWVATYVSLSGALLASNNLSDVTSASSSRTNLGLGTIATQAANNVNITGGSISSITDLAVVDGGTGASTASGARTNLGLVIGTDVLAPNGSAASLTSFPTLNQNTTGTASNVTGTVAIANGGTGATTRQAAMDALAGAVTSGQYLRGDGTDVVMSAIQAVDVPTLNQNTTGTASNVTGTVAVANGGTGATTQSGARTGLGLGTIATQNANSVGITGGAIDGAPLGATTPAAGTFTTLTATGQTDLGGDVVVTNTPLIFKNASNNEAFRINTSGANYWQVFGATTPVLRTNGGATSAKIGMGGAFPLSFVTNSIGTEAEQLRVSHTASAVNYVQVTGNITNNAPSVISAGSDANVGLSLSSKATGQIGFFTNSANSNSRHLDITHTGSVVNRFTLTGSQTGFGVTLGLNGTDTNISQVFQSKGTGAIDLAAGSSGVNISNGGTVTAITRTTGGTGYTTLPTVAVSAPTTAGGVQATLGITIWVESTPTVVSGGTGYTNGDVLTLSGGTFTVAATLTVTGVSGGVITSVSVAGAARGSYTVAPSNPISVTGGTGSGATFNATFGVNSTITITNAGSGYVEQPTVTFSGGGGGSGAAAYATVGSGAIIKALGSTGTQGLDFYTASSASNGVPVLRLRDTVSDSYTMLGGTASVATITAQGNTNAVMQITANGSGSVRFATQGVSVTEQMRVAHTASAVNYVQVTGAATTVAPTISFQGSDTNISGSFVSKGSGTLRFLTNTAVEQLRVLHTGSAVNYTTATGNIAGSAPVFGVAGSDTNIDLTLTPKGTGNVRFGTYTAGVLTPTGYIEVKDSGGTVRRLLVG
jgi:hypothetical protein